MLFQILLNRWIRRKNGSIQAKFFDHRAEIRHANIPLYKSRPLIAERLEDRIVPTIDFGDVPAPFPTTLTEDGARHIDTGPTMGASRDTEANGTHSANADADGADEDGVTFGTIQVGALDAGVTVNVQGSSARLDA